MALYFCFYLSIINIHRCPTMETAIALTRNCQIDIYLQFNVILFSDKFPPLVLFDGIVRRPQLNREAGNYCNCVKFCSDTVASGLLVAKEILFRRARNTGGDKERHIIDGYVHMQSNPINSDIMIPLGFDWIKRRNDFVRVKRKLTCSFHDHMLRQTRQ